MAVIALFLTVLCLWIGGQGIYNICLHPLRHYPGPLSCRISSLPRIYHRLAGTCMQHAHAAHEKHGPVVRLSPRELSFTSSDAWNDIYARHGGGAALPKEPGFNSSPPDVPRGLFHAQDGAPHARQRRIFGPAFTNTALRAQEPLLRGHVRKLVASVRRACEEGGGGGGGGGGEGVVNMADLFNFLTFDVMADLAFGAPLGLLDAGVYSPWVRNVFAVFRLLCLRVVLLQYLPLVSRMLTPLLASKAVVEKRKAHMGYASGLVDKRLDRSEDLGRPDIWTLVEKKGDALTRAEMHANAALFMAAGTETTATALAGTVWLLTKHPEAMKSVVKEIRGVEGGEEAFTMETLAKLPYLDAVINESMRLYPPTPDMLYRLVPEGGAVISGSHVPAGASTISIIQPASSKSLG
ncbi:putative sterigmatocystin biosynthesis P450 monooxygenase stcF [Botryosphaeria dothidea]|uniref:Sterigmatocystin biosynthesis P450 monooxygenase stcF n=1 Tax=Botryosphaeria dothidea TaxID=55169 RepID=A0A8H4J276_9PEZI|nr:putative sterigmatocystin biosynthesis P450 monooxygenase stcF [Botryosphaeria dothidea]